MHRVLANAVALAGLLLPWCPYAQARGAPHASFSHSGGYYRSSAVVVRPHYAPPRQVRTFPRASYTLARNWTFPPVAGSSLVNPGAASCLLNPSVSGTFYCRQYYSGRPALGYEPVYPSWFPATGAETEEPAPAAPDVPQDSQLAAQVGNLAAEVEMMREDQALRSSRGAETPAEAEENPPTTLLVYRDGHQMEVQEYAIQGQTLWVFSDQATRRVPLADLDLAATERLNGERGVEFVPPNTQ